MSSQKKKKKLEDLSWILFTFKFNKRKIFLTKKKYHLLKTSRILAGFNINFIKFIWFNNMITSYKPPH
jgi:hypothetical protein